MRANLQVRCWLVVLAVAVAFPLSGVSPAVALDPFPLRPPETSSPQATFRSFIQNMNAAIHEHLNHDAYPTQKEWNTVVDRHIDRALGCLDLSEIPLAQRDTAGLEAALFLKEIFDRIELPDYKDIPNRDELGDAPPPFWVVPNTEIAIGRVEEGRREGQQRGEDEGQGGDHRWTPVRASRPVSPRRRFRRPAERVARPVPAADPSPGEIRSAGR